MRQNQIERGAEEGRGLSICQPVSIWMGRAGEEFMRARGSGIGGVGVTIGVTY